MKSEFFHRDLIQIFPSVKPRTIISWTERGLIEPEFEDASGRGSARRYSYRNLMEITFISELLRFGVPFSFINQITESSEYRSIIADRKWSTTFWITYMDKKGRAFSSKAGGHLTVKAISVDNFSVESQELVKATKSAILVNMDAINQALKKRISDLNL
jgi:DNA-binding transcriptional MerR regulator